MTETISATVIERGQDTDPRIEMVNHVGAKIIRWIGEVYPDVPQAEAIAKDAIALFIGGMQEPELLERVP
jgi:hypothetical protein